MQVSTFSGFFANLEKIIDFVLIEARKLGFSSKEEYQISLAVDEACSNVIEHAYGGESNQPIQVSVDTNNNKLSIIIEDHGASFNPDEVLSPDVCSPLEERVERGLGIFTMCKVMDEVKYEFPEPGLNRLIMVKNKRA